MTFQEIKTECTNRSDTVLDDAYWTSWINLAYQNVSAILRNIQDTTIRKKSSSTTVASQSNYTLPTGFSKPIKLYVDTTEYSRIDYEDATQSGLTNSYYIDKANNEYVLVPAPSTSGSTIAFYYESEITNMSVGTDEPYFPVRYHEILVYGALSRYHEYEKEMGKATYYAAQFQNMLTELIDFWTRYSKDDVISMGTLYDKSNTSF